VRSTHPAVPAKGSCPLFAPSSVIVALPGPPRELQPMVRDELVPYLARRFGTRLPGCSLLLRFVGVGQSLIDHTMKEHVPLPPDVTVFSHFEEMPGRFHVHAARRHATEPRPAGRLEAEDPQTTGRVDLRR